MNTAAVAPAVESPIPLAAGERLIGVTLHEDKLHHLVLLPGEIEGTYAEAQAFAEKQGGVLPSRIDMLVCFEHARDAFKPDWYWTGQQHADAPAYAWVQSFHGGSQGWTHKSYRGRVFAVRRTPIR